MRDVTVSMVIFYVMGDVVVAHLAASDSVGYELAAAFAIHQVAVEEFGARGHQWLDLGSTSGVEADPSDGLVVFKRGWTKTMRPTYLCGRIYDRDAYASLETGIGGGPASYFPAYRGGPRDAGV